jgi:hypothetical protein
MPGHTHAGRDQISHRCPIGPIGRIGPILSCPISPHDVARRPVVDYSPARLISYCASLHVIVGTFIWFGRVISRKEIL